MMPQFDEIAHTGGRISFDYSDAGVAVGIVHHRPTAATIFQVCINFEGQIVGYVAATGEGGPSFYPQPSVIALLVSDQEGLFGQRCKACASYYRTLVLSNRTTCPYCGFIGRGPEFLTANQIQFLTNFYTAYVEAMEGKVSKQIDLDSMLDSLSHNEPSWVYTEERQQNKSRCPSCRNVYDVLGRYARCPACGAPNYEHTFDQAMAAIRAQITPETVDAANLPGETLSKAFSEYEAFGNAVRRQLLRLPMTPRRRTETEKINFQRLAEAERLLDLYFGVNATEGLETSDTEFLNLMVNRRHILIHEGGRVDERYLRQTKDSSVRLNETIKVAKNDVERTQYLLHHCAMNLLKAWTSIK